MSAAQTAGCDTKSSLELQGSAHIVRRMTVDPQGPGDSHLPQGLSWYLLCHWYLVCALVAVMSLMTVATGGAPGAFDVIGTMI